MPYLPFILISQKCGLLENNEKRQQCFSRRRNGGPRQINGRSSWVIQFPVFAKKYRCSSSCASTPPPSLIRSKRYNCGSFFARLRHLQLIKSVNVFEMHYTEQLNYVVVYGYGELLVAAIAHYCSLKDISGIYSSFVPRDMSWKYVELAGAFSKVYLATSFAIIRSTFLRIELCMTKGSVGQLGHNLYGCY